MRAYYKGGDGGYEGVVEQRRQKRQADRQTNRPIA